MSFLEIMSEQAAEKVQAAISPQEEYERQLQEALSLSFLDSMQREENEESDLEMALRLSKEESLPVVPLLFLLVSF